MTKELSHLDLDIINRLELGRRYKSGVNLKVSDRGLMLADVWNALSARSTTMKKDIPAMYANLLGINAYQILSLSDHEWLYATLLGNEFIPVDFLYNRGPRYQADQNHNGHWIPIAPHRSRLSRRPVMKLVGSNGLIIKSETMQDEKPTLIVVKQSIPVTKLEIILRLDNRQVVHVVFHRQADDKIDYQRFKAFGLLVKKNSKESCCLRFQKAQSNDDLQTVYDCPCTVIRLGANESEAFPVDFEGSAFNTWSKFSISTSMPPLVAFIIICLFDDIVLISPYVQKLNPLVPTRRNLLITNSMKLVVCLPLIDRALFDNTGLKMRSFKLYALGKSHLHNLLD